VREMRQKATQAALSLQKEVAKASGREAAWNEEGGVVYECPLWRECVVALRDFAKEQDDSFPQLTGHLFKGFYVPVPFPRVETANEGVVLRKMVEIGSSNALLDELNLLARALDVGKRWETLRDNEGLGTDDLAKVGWAVLESLARKSVETTTPICFDGEQ
jgi:hypothetical protein